MSAGDIFVDGNPPIPISGQEMCEYVIAAGLRISEIEHILATKELPGDGS